MNGTREACTMLYSSRNKKYMKLRVYFKAYLIGNCTASLIDLHYLQLD